MTEPIIITIWMHVTGRGQKDAIVGLKFCDDLVVAINRDSDRRAEVATHKTRPWCRVVDYSTPQKQKSYCGHVEYNLITGWVPMIDIVSPPDND